MRPLNWWLLYITFLAGNTVVDSDESSFTTRFTGIKCSPIEKYIANIYCNIKPVRGGIGIIRISVIPKIPMNDLWLQSTLFYKFGTIYREWLLKFDIDLCLALSGRPSTDVMTTMFAAFWKKYISKAKCPIGALNVTMNGDNSTNTLMYSKIPRLPQGDYKYVHRIHTRNNETLGMYELKFTVKSKMGVNRTSMLDMG